jgi:hypothetical protein
MNEARLVANNSPRPAGPDEDGDPNYRDSHVRASAGLTVPVLWLSLFAESDIRVHESEEGDVPAPVAPLSAALSNWSRRRPVLETAFPGYTAEFDAWAEAIQQLKAKYIKIDAEELWAMGDAEFEADLRGGLRWFDSAAVGDFERLLNLLASRGNFNADARTFGENAAGAAFFLYGHAWRLPPLKPPGRQTQHSDQVP